MFTGLKYIHNYVKSNYLRGTAVAQWLRCCATNPRSLARSQLVSVDFSLTQNPSDRPMALGSTQPLTEMSTRSISCG